MARNMECNCTDETVLPNMMRPGLKVVWTVFHPHKCEPEVGYVEGTVIKKVGMLWKVDFYSKTWDMVLEWDPMQGPYGGLISNRHPRTYFLGSCFFDEFQIQLK